MNEQFNNIDDIIKQANASKEELLDKKEASLDINEHPIDHLDILIAECNLENCERSIETIKKIVSEHPELTGELLEQIQDQKKYAENKKEKSKKIEDGETRLKESMNLDNKLRALAKLGRAIDRRSKDRDGDGE
ncbi:MAG: hypothetical protein AAB621_00620 [Patescibacteria group bacterium]|mgnify:CR=1 FL=1